MFPKDIVKKVQSVKYSILQEFLLNASLCWVVAAR